MAAVSTRKASSRINQEMKAKPALFSTIWNRSSLVGGGLLLLLFLGLDVVNQGGISCFFQKHYSLKLVGHIRGADQPCGLFKVGGVAYLQGSGIEVLDSDHNRFLLFDLKGQFLQVLPNSAPIVPAAVTDAVSGLTYTADWNGYRVVVTDKSGKIQRNIYVRDRPLAVALDGKGTLFVSFGNHFFLQAYSLKGWFRGDGKVENPDPDTTYLDVTSLSGTDRGLLLAADPYSVWIYQLPQ